MLFSTNVEVELMFSCRSFDNIRAKERSEMEKFLKLLTKFSLFFCVALAILSIAVASLLILKPKIIAMLLYYGTIIVCSITVISLLAILAAYLFFNNKKREEPTPKIN